MLQNPALATFLNFPSSTKNVGLKLPLVSEKIKIKKKLNDDGYHLMPKDRMVSLPMWTKYSSDPIVFFPKNNKICSNQSFLTETIPEKQCLKGLEDDHPHHNFKKKTELYYFTKSSNEPIRAFHSHQVFFPGIALNRDNCWMINLGLTSLKSCV